MGANGPVLRIERAPDGTILAGGDFSVIGNAKVRNIARWDGSNWSGLGTGANFDVQTIAFVGNEIIIGGNFTEVGGVSANRVARWDGSQWHAMGEGFSSTIQQVAVFNGAVLAVGARQGIKQWDGVAWRAFGNTTSEDISSLEVIGSSLYAAGSFQSINGVNARSIALWNGTSWSQVGGGVAGINNAIASVYDMDSDGAGNLYIGGSFTTAGGQAASKLAKWDGLSWSSLGANISASGGEDVTSLRVIGSALWVSGHLSSVGGVALNYIAIWNGFQWTKLSNEVNWIATDFFGDGSRIWISGGHTASETVPTSYLSILENGSWISQFPIAGPNGKINAMVRVGSDIYVGGAFTQIGDVPARRIAKWNGLKWSAVGGGVDDVVYALAADADGNIFAGGAFRSAGGANASRIAKWDGTSWRGMGEGFNADVTSIAVDPLGNIFTGGYFSSSGATALGRVAKWNGTGWINLSGGVNDFVSSVVVDLDGSLLVGGNFSAAYNGATYEPNTRNIARWRESSWTAVNSTGVDSPVYSIFPTSNSIFLGRGAGVASISRSDGSLSNYIESPIGAKSFALVNGELYVAGILPTATQNYGIAKFNFAERKWKQVEDTTVDSGRINAMVTYGRRIIVGGEFSYLGCRVSANFGEFYPLRNNGNDFDGDGKTDVGIWRQSGASGGAEYWYLKSGGATGAYGAFGFGQSTDIPVPADYTGDGKTDLAFFRPSNGYWYVLRSDDFSYYAFPFGAGTDTPAPADFDGDGKADAAVYRASAGTWFILRSTNGGVDSVPFGATLDKPIPADFDGDGKADVAVWRQNGTLGAEWWILGSTSGPRGFGFGESTDKAVPGDYTGDGKTDLAFFRPGNGQWYVLRSEDLSFYAFPFGAGTDTPSPGDYDGDGKTDAAVFRSGQWYIVKSSNGGADAVPFGMATDKPIVIVRLP